MLEAGRRAWPDLEVAAEAFCAFADAHHAELAHAADLYLAFSAGQASAKGLAHLDQILRAQTAAAVRRFSRGPDFAHEVEQRLRSRLLVAEPGEEPRVLQYAGRGPLASWIRAAALRVAIDLARPSPLTTEAPASALGAAAEAISSTLKS